LTFFIVVGYDAAIQGAYLIDHGAGAIILWHHFPETTSMVNRQHTTHERGDRSVKRAVPRILIVDDDVSTASYLRRLMEKEGYRSLIAVNGKAAVKKLPEDPPDVLFLGIAMSGIHGIEILKEAKKLIPALPVIIITACATVATAVEAMKLGAHDYLSKPLDCENVVNAVHSAVQKRNTLCSLDPDSFPSGHQSTLAELMGPSDRVAELTALVNRVAQSDYTIILQGETGTGKELLAREIHNSSKRAARPFLAIDCGAIPEHLLESELFGSERGAFTGAEHQRPGRFELAQDGTILLDEISNMPLSSQAKLLRVMQEKSVFRLGGTRSLPIQVRVLVASNQDLHSLAASGVFRKDLFYRLNEFVITLPPLRERQEDIPYLANRFLTLANVELNKTIRGLSGSALTALRHYPWPGNVRQLRSTIRRAALLADSVVMEHHLDITFPSISAGQVSSRSEESLWKNLSYKEIVRRKTIAVERAVLSEALKRTAGNKARAARILQIDYKTLHTKLKQLGIQEGIDTHFKVQSSSFEVDG